MLENGGILYRAMDIQQSFKVGENDINVIKSCNFEIKEKTFNIIYGPSGSGKSTLLNILSGLQKPTSGKLIYRGKDLYKLSRQELAHFRSKEIGTVYQSDFWVSSLNVIENVALPLFFTGMSRMKAKKLAQDALQRVDMATSGDKDPKLLSGGEQQRVAMARAIVTEPSLIIADEPTGSLDSINGDMIMALLQGYRRDLDRTVVLVTHNMEYLSMADYLINVQDGNIEELESDNIAATTEKLVNDMRDRIDHYAKLKATKKYGEQ